MHNSITYTHINPWLYPENIILTTNNEFQQHLVQLINYSNTKSHSIHRIHSHKYCQYLIQFGLFIQRHNINCHVILKHYLPTLSLFHNSLKQIIPNLQGNNYIIIWRARTELMTVVLKNVSFDLKVYHNVNIKEIIESMLEAVAICTEKQFDYEILNLYSKYMYLLMKIQYNNKKIASRIKQHEQISVLPWEIPDTEQIKVRNELQKKWKEMKEMKMNKYIEEKENYDNMHNQISHHNIHINNIKKT
eukprot:250586_1